MMRRLLVALSWFIAVGCVANIFVFSMLASAGGQQVTPNLPLLLAFLAFPLAGALIVSQRSTNTVGWLFCAAGVGTWITSFSAAYVQRALHIHADAQLATGLIDLAGDLVWPINMCLGILLLYLFPDGRPLSPRWRFAVWTLVLTLIVIVAGQAVYPGPLESHNRVPNPLGMPALAAASNFALNDLQSLIAVFLLLAITSLILRYRRAADVQRQQIKWFVFGSAVMIILIAGGIFGSGLISSDPADPIANGVQTITFALGILALPLGAMVGVLRYRLYDIDVIIKRTLVYGSLTIILAALYAGLVIGLGDLVGLVSNQVAQNPAVVVVATLAIAALFQPLRRSIQSTIDRRFYRAKYDAARTLAAFGATLRGKVELDDLSASLLDVVEETMQPAWVSLWLRPPRVEKAEPARLTTP